MNFDEKYVEQVQKGLSCLLLQLLEHVANEQRYAH